MKIILKGTRVFIFLFFLIGCEEIDGTFSFDKDGSGSLTVQMAFSDDDTDLEVEDCQNIISPEVEWDNISNANQECTYIKQFSDLYEVEKLHEKLNLNLRRVTIDNIFVYKATETNCDSDSSLADNEYIKKITWNLIIPGTLKSHNADKIAGNKLTWNITNTNCYDIYVESVLFQPLQEKEINQEQDIESQIPEKIMDEPQDKDTTISKDSSENFWKENTIFWFTIGASAATILGTIIAYMEYRNR